MHIEKILCGESFRYWYEQETPNYYHYFDVQSKGQVSIKGTGF